MFGKVAASVEKANQASGSSAGSRHVVEYDYKYQ